MAEIDELWRRGQFRAAYDASCRANAVIPEGYPFRTACPPDEIAQRWHDHGQLCWHNARFAEAEAAFDRAYAMRERTHGAEHPLALDTLERRAALAHYQRAYTVARERFEQVITGFVAIHGDDHVRVAVARRNYAACLRDLGRPYEAQVLLDRAIAVFDRELPAEHPDVAAALKVEALLHHRGKSHWAAIRSAERAIDIGRRIWDHDHPFVASAELTLAAAEAEVGQRKRAVRRYDRIIANLERAYGDHPLVGLALSQYASALHGAGDNYEHAVALSRRGLEMHRRYYPEQSFVFRWRLLTLMVDAGRPVDAADLALEFDPELSRRDRFKVAAHLANAFWQVGDHRAAQPWVERARDTCDDPATRERWAARAEALPDADAQIR